jgi:hypothetical protein
MGEKKHGWGACVKRLASIALAESTRVVFSDERTNTLGDEIGGP